MIFSALFNLCICFPLALILLHTICTRIIDLKMLFTRFILKIEACYKLATSYAFIQLLFKLLFYTR